MATPTYKALATTTLTSATSSITFGSISGSYRDLVLVISTRSSTAGAGDNMGIYFNGDASSCSTIRMYAQPYATGSTSAPTSTRIAQISVPASDGTDFGAAIINIMDYSATDKHTRALIRSNSVFDQAHAATGRYANTNAITSITCDLYVTSANFVAGSTFSLFGIEA